MLLLGKPVSQALKATQTARIAASAITPCLAIIQVGDNLASTTYINMKRQYSADIGASVDHHRLSGNLTELHRMIRACNADPQVHGLMIQLPLPDPSVTDELVAAITPTKDVDGQGPNSQFSSATALAVIKLLEHYEVKLTDTPITLVGNGRLVGQPLTKLLRQRDARLTVCDIETTPADLVAATRAASVVISATGVPALIKPDMIRDRTVLIDVGTAEDAGAIVGDVDPAILENPTLQVTPAKGGIGPITVAVLFEQLLTAAGL